MIEKLLHRLGRKRTTLLLSAVCISLSVLISSTVWFLLGFQYLFCVVIISFLCPFVMAPPIIYFYSRLSEELETSRKKLEASNRELRKNLQEITELRGLLPICAWCKSIRDDTGYWSSIESYLLKHSNAEFSHSVCPDCAKKLTGEMDASLSSKP